MTAKTIAEQQTAKALAKELRERDAALAMQEYQLETLALRARTERLRALRLSKGRPASKDQPKPPGAFRKKA
jgi:hypothetical protein